MNGKGISGGFILESSRPPRYLVLGLALGGDDGRPKKTKGNYKNLTRPEKESMTERGVRKLSGYRGGVEG